MSCQGPVDVQPRPNQPDLTGLTELDKQLDSLLTLRSAYVTKRLGWFDSNCVDTLSCVENSQQAVR